MIGLFGAACVLGIAATGSAIGIGIAGQATIGAWKRCYVNNKPAPATLIAFAGAPLTQTIYGFLLMRIMVNSQKDGMFLLALGLFSGLAMAASAVFRGKAGADPGTADPDVPDPDAEEPEAEVLAPAPPLDVGPELPIGVGAGVLSGPLPACP